MKPFVSLFLLISLGLCLPFHITAQWDRQYPLKKLESVLDIAFHPDGYGYAVGSNDLILKLDPGTQKWDLLLTWQKSWRLEAVDYLENSNGTFVAAGGQGLILSQDSGDSWEEIANSPTGIHAIKIISATEIVVSSDIGVYVWKNNAWTNLNLPASLGVQGAFILDRDHIWAFVNGTNSIIYYTTNGGQTWSMNSEINKPDLVRFYNSQYGISTDGRMVYKTINGGQKWTLVSNNAIHNTSNDLTFGSTAAIMMAATLNGEPAVTQDSGKTWLALTTGLINQRNYSIASKSDSEYWVGNDLSGIAVTKNGGFSWDESVGPLRSIVQDVHFINRQVGYACGIKGYFLRTSDGGTHWEDVSFGTRSLLDIDGLNANDLWIGSNQRIFHSDNNGTTWTEKATIVGANINDVHPISSARVLAVSSTGIIYRTINSGATWDTVYHGANQQLRSIARIDDQRYMVTGFNGIILRSDDQGASWNMVTIPEPALQYESSYFLGNEGWLVTSSFKKSMWHTTDAGNTWDTLTLPIDRFWDGVYFISPDTGIVVAHTSAEGRAYITFNGGQNWQSGYITSYQLYGVTGLPNPNGTAWIFGYGSDIEVLPYCNALPVISNLTGNFFPCEKDTLVYSIDATNIEDYFWHFPSGWTFVGDPNQSSVTVVAGKNFGAVSVVGTNVCGFSGQLSSGVSPISLPFLSGLSGDATPCEGEVINYTVNETDANDFVWSIPGDWSIFGNQNQSSIMVQVGSTAGNILVSASNTCGIGDPISLSVTPQVRPRMHGVSGEASPCEGRTVTYTADDEFTDQVQWTYPADWEVVGASDQSVIELKVTTTAGKVSATGINPCGLSATAEYNVTPFDIPDIVITNNGNALSVNAVGIGYQWFLNGQPIANATGPTYFASVAGEYTVTVVFPNTCLALSPALPVILSGVKNADLYLPLSIYPVPANDLLYVNGIENGFNYSITDMTGKNILKEVAQENNLSVSSLPEGMYLIRVEKEGRLYLGRFAVLRR